jgi:hypothetical protein
MYLNKLIVTALVVSASLFCSGQAARTPFSSFGYGDAYSNALIHNQGMGGAGVSTPQYWFLNNMNPALLTYNRITVFQAGLVLDRKRIYSDTLRENTRGGNLNYLALGFPVLRNKKTGVVLWGTAVGLMPYTNVNYRYSYIDTVAGSGGTLVEYLEEATGGFSEFYWSNGVYINRYVSLGLKSSFLFSSINTNFSNLVAIPNQNNSFVVSVNELQSIKGVKFTPGIYIRKDSIRTRYVWNLGATVDITSSVSTSLDQVLQRKDAGGSIIESDTVRVNTGNSNLNRNWVIGTSFGRPDRWMLAADLTLIRPARDFITLGLDQVPVDNGWRIAVGAELTPDSRSLSSYLKRITYRTGFSSEQGTYLVNGNAVKDFGINFGFSLPVSRISSLDIAFRTGKRGDEKLNGIEENYFKVYFGVTFNDQWFIKRRFD